MRHSRGRVILFTRMTHGPAIVSLAILERKKRPARLRHRTNHIIIINNRHALFSNKNNIFLTNYNILPERYRIFHSPFDFSITTNFWCTSHIYMHVSYVYVFHCFLLFYDLIFDYYWITFKVLPKVLCTISLISAPPYGRVVKNTFGIKSACVHFVHKVR